MLGRVIRMEIRRAEKKDIARLEHILYQVQDVHAVGRPDLFIKGKKKYSAAELEEIIVDDKRPIFVYADDSGLVLGYAFCIDKSFEGSDSMNPDKMLYIDDLCVDEESRGEHVGKALCEYVRKYAAENGYTRVTLNVWELTKGARAFYDALGFTPLKTTMEVRL